MWWSVPVALAVLAAEPEALSFDQARTLAVTRAPEARLASLRENVAQAGVRTAGAWLNPTLTLTTAAQTARLSSGVSLPLPVFGQLGVARDAAEADLVAARADSVAIRLQVTIESALAWLDLWEAQARATLMNEAATDAARLSNVAKERFAAGSAPEVDVVRARAVEVQAKADATTQASAVGAMAARLQAWLGPEPEGGWRAAGEPRFPEQPPALPQVAANLDAHPALAHDEQLIAAAAAHVKSEERQRLPVVDALLTVTAGDPSLGYAPDVIGGLAFELPVLNQRGGPVDKARADEAIAREQAAADRLRFDAALREAHVRATAASERVVAFERDVLPAAVKARAMTQEGYQDGRVDLLRLLEAQRAVLEARLSSLDARVAYQRAMVELERTSGVELIPKETP